MFWVDKKLLDSCESNRVDYETWLRNCERQHAAVMQKCEALAERLARHEAFVAAWDGRAYRDDKKLTPACYARMEAARAAIDAQEGEGA